MDQMAYVRPAAVLLYTTRLMLAELYLKPFPLRVTLKPVGTDEGDRVS